MPDISLGRSLPCCSTVPSRQGKPTLERTQPARTRYPFEFHGHSSLRLTDPIEVCPEEKYERKEEKNKPRTPGPMQVWDGKII